MPKNNKPHLYQVNLKEHIEKYAWKRFRATEGFFKTMFMRKSRYYVDIRWGYLHFDHKTTPTEHQRPKSGSDAERKNVELYLCEYENKTEDEQTHKFSTSRETTATTKVEFQENYTIGAETNIEVDLGFVKAGGGVNGGLSVTKTDGEEYSESLTWNIDTEIKVPAKQKATAKLHVYEEPTIMDFEVETKVTLPKNRLPVAIRRISDDKLIGNTIWIQNIDAIFEPEYLEKAKNLIEVIDIEDQEAGKIYVGLKLKSHGTAQNVSFKNQTVTVECTPLPGYEDYVPTKKGFPKKE